MVPRSARFAVLSLVAAALVGVACEKAKSANPLSPELAGPLPDVTITAPDPVEPAPGAQLSQTDQLTTLVIANPESTGVRPLWMQLQVAADEAFQQVLHLVDRLPLEPDGQTTYALPEPLPPGKTFYWRVRALDGANSGPYSPVAHFSVVQPVVIEAPAAIEPSGTLATRSPVFKVRNPQVTGTAGNIVINFEVARTLNNVDAVITVAPGADGYATMTLGELPYDQTVHWRVNATDGESTSPYSQLMTFRTPPAPATPPAPGPSPPPTTPPTTPPPSSPPPTGGGQRTISIDEALSIVRSVHDAEGWDLGSRSSREGRVEFFFRAVATIHYGHPRFNPKGPDANWCVKDAGGGRPPSDDVIVRCDSREAWDLIGSAGADGYRFHLDSIGRLGGGQNVFAPPRSALPR